MMNENNGNGVVNTEHGEEFVALENIVKEEENNIQDYYKRIGELYAAIHGDDESFDGDFLPLMTALNMSKERIKAVRQRQLELREVKPCPECGEEIASDSDSCNVCTEILNNEKEFSASVYEDIVKVCSYCGTLLEADSIFCTECGNRVEAEVETEAVEPEEAVIEEHATETEPEAVPEMTETAVEEPEIIEELEVETAQEPETKVCAYCGALIEADSIFCTECGKKVEAEVETETVEPEEAVIEEHAPETELEAAPEMTVTEVEEPEITEESEVETAQEPETKVCAYCGALIEADSIFCTECGKKVEAEVETAEDEAVIIEEFGAVAENPIIEEEKNESINVDNFEENSCVNDEVPSEKVVCEHCGTVINYDGLFCIECGNKLPEKKSASDLS